MTRRAKGWTLSVNERTPGIYDVTAVHMTGSKVVAMATEQDLDRVIDRVVEDARKDAPLGRGRVRQQPLAAVRRGSTRCVLGGSLRGVWSRTYASLPS
jgi:hypothetical protein